MATGPDTCHLSWMERDPAKSFERKLSRMPIGEAVMSVLVLGMLFFGGPVAALNLIGALGILMGGAWIGDAVGRWAGRAVFGMPPGTSRRLGSAGAAFGFFVLPAFFAAAVWGWDGEGNVGDALLIHLGWATFVAIICFLAPPDDQER